MLRRDLLKAISAFIAAGSAVAEATQKPAAGFTPPAQPAEPEPAVFCADVQPSYITQSMSPQMIELRQSLLSGDQLPVEIVRTHDGRKMITFFPPEAAERLGTTKALQAKAIDIIEHCVPTTATIYNGGAACEVWFKRLD